MKTLTEYSFSLRIEHTFSRLISKLGLAPGHFRWLLLPMLFLLLIVQLAFSKPCVFTSFLPLVASFTFLLCLFFKTTGLTMSYMILFSIVLRSYREFLPEESLWQMGILFALAIDLFVTLLCIEKVEEDQLFLQKKNEEGEKSISEIKEHYRHEERKYNEYIESLKDTVQELIREIEQRRIEKREAIQEQESLQNEIAHLTEQNKTLTVDLFVAKSEAKESALHYEQLLERPIRDGYQERFEASQITIEELENRIHALQKEVFAHENDSKRSMAELEGRYKQLRSQFEEKKAILDKTRQELFETETALLAIEKEKTPYTQDYEKIYREMEKQLVLSVGEQSMLKEEILILEQLINFYIVENEN